MPCQLCKIDRDTRCEKEIDRIAGWVAWIGSNLRDLAAMGDETFAQQKPGGQFFVVARSAHGDADRPRIDLNFQRFFGGQGVGGANGL